MPQNAKPPVKLSLPLVLLSSILLLFAMIAEHYLGIPARYASPCLFLVSTTEPLDIFNEIRSEDELLVLARGLGLIRVVTNLLHSYDAAGNNLIIVVGADERENGWIGEGETCPSFVRGTNVDVS